MCLSKNIIFIDLSIYESSNCACPSSFFMWSPWLPQATSVTGDDKHSTHQHGDDLGMVQMAMGWPWKKCETDLWEVYWYGGQFMNIRRFGTTRNCDFFPPVEAFSSDIVLSIFPILPRSFGGVQFFPVSQGIQVLDRDLPSGKGLQKTMERSTIL